MAVFPRVLNLPVCSPRQTRYSSFQSWHHHIFSIAGLPAASTRRQYADTIGSIQVSQTPQALGKAAISIPGFTVLLPVSVRFATPFQALACFMRLQLPESTSPAEQCQSQTKSYITASHASMLLAVSPLRPNFRAS